MFVAIDNENSTRTAETLLASGISAGFQKDENHVVHSVDWRTAKVDEDITQTLKTDLARMSGPCITQEHFRKSRRAQSSEDHETWVQDGISNTLNTFDVGDARATDVVTSTMFKIRGGSEVETGEQGGTPGKKAGKGYLGSEESAFTIAATQDQFLASNVIGFQPGQVQRGFGPKPNSEVSATLKRVNNDQSPHIASFYSNASSHMSEQVDVSVPVKVGSSGSAGNPPAIAGTMAVRRLTPIECERLQGFPDGWTQIPWRKKAAEDCPDGPRYKAIGNSMAVNVMQWIGLRLEMFIEMEIDQKLKKS